MEHGKKRKFNEITPKLKYKNDCGICSFEMIDCSTCLFIKYKCIKCGNLEIKLK
jgi:hypothetical protein